MGMFTLALGSLITLIAIIADSAVTQKIQYHVMDNLRLGRAVHLARADLRLVPGRKQA